MQFIILTLVVVLLLWAIATPLRRHRPDGAEPGPPLRDLEAAREAKYREIRDAELDLRTGKLSTEDHAAIDGALRAEAVEILHALDAADPPASPSAAPEGPVR